MISGQPYTRAVAAHLIVTCGILLAACGGGTAVTELGGPGAVRCQVSLAAEPRVVPADGGAVAVTVNAARDCTWDASTSASWTTLNPTNGQGAGTISVAVAPSQQPSVRTVAISVNDQRVDLSQEARPCRFTLASDGAEVGPAGGTVIVSVATAAGCSWRATSTTGWIVAPADARTGPGSVELSVSVNPGPRRDAIVTVANEAFTVTQHATGFVGPIATNCAPIVQPARLDVPAPAATEMIRIDVAAGCAWTAISNTPWLTVASEAAGQGPATVRIAIAQNSGPVRTGTLRVASQDVTVVQAAPTPAPPPACTFTIDPDSRSVGSSGGEERVDIATRDGCEWTAASPANWITILTTRGSGGGQVRYRVQANAATQSRSATITIAGRPHRVTQAGAAPTCTLSLVPPSASLPAGGGEAKFNVVTQAGCAWSATVGSGPGGSAGWIALVSGSGNGPGEVVYTVQPNPGTQPRTGSINVGTQAQNGQAHTVSQAGGAPACTYGINPASTAMASAGGEGRFAVTTQPGCPWAVTGGAPWLNVSAGSGNGPGEVVYSAQANTAPEPRSATLTVAGQIHTINQAGAAPVCSYTVDPPSLAIPAGGGEGRMTLTTQGGCVWSVTGAPEWLAIANPSGAGTAAVVYTVQPNPSPEPRSASLVAGGQAHTVTQAGAAPACTFTLQPASQAIPAAGGEGRFAVTTQPGCSWSTSGGAGWITIAVNAGNGPGEVVYNAQPNTAPDARNATIFVGGQAHTVTQPGTPPPCTYSLNPSAFAAASAGGEGRFTVQTQPGCAWNAVPTVDWISLVAGSGTGPGETVYTVQANPGVDSRVGSVTVAGQSHSVTQAGTTPPPPTPPPSPPPQP